MFFQVTLQNEITAVLGVGCWKLLSSALGLEGFQKFSLLIYTRFDCSAVLAEVTWNMLFIFSLVTFVSKCCFYLFHARPVFFSFYCFCLFTYMLDILLVSSSTFIKLFSRFSRVESCTWQTEQKFKCSPAEVF